MTANANTKPKASVKLKVKNKRKGGFLSTDERPHYAKGFFFIANNKGLHTRPSTELVKCAALFNAQIHLIYQDFIVNAKSLLGILTLAATRGSRILVEAEGDDAKQAVETIIELAENKFHIHY